MVAIQLRVEDRVASAMSSHVIVILSILVEAISGMFSYTTHMLS
jgi:hypothetical protein